MRGIPTSLLILWCVVAHPLASAQIRRCVTADGARIFTDRPCADVDAQEVIAPPASSTNEPDRRPSLCPRNLQALTVALSSAIQSGDANRVSSLYDWSGTSTASASRLMDRLQTIADRPLVDIRPIYRQSTTSADRFSTEPQQRTRAAPVGLRVEQVLRNQSTPSQSEFFIRKRMGCWWIHF